MVSLFILYMKCLYFLPFNSLKCLNLNSIITGVLRLDDLGWLTLVRGPFKCLNLNPIIPGVLGPDDLGWLTLVRSHFKCLNLNPIIPGVL